MNQGDDLDGQRELMLQPNDAISINIPESSNFGIDDMLQRWTGKFRWWRRKDFVLASFAWTLEAIFTMVMIFADHQPAWHCKRGFQSCSPTRSICSMDRASWDWDGGSGVSTVSEWGLICDQKYKVGVVQSAFFVGCLLGAWLFGHLSESSLGRKGLLSLVCVCNTILGFLTALSPNFCAYLILRLLTGITTSGVGLSSFVLATEAVGPSITGLVSMSTLYFFSFGIAVLPVLSYFLGSWRYLYVASSILSVLYCLLVLPFIPESPQWCLVKGRLEEALRVMGGVSLKLDDDAEPKYESSGSALDVLRSPLTRTRMVLMALTWFLVAVVYYGLSLNVVNVGTNLYISVFLNAIAEMIAIALTAAMLDKFGRRTMLISSMVLSGLFCLLGFITTEFLHVHNSNPMFAGRMQGFVTVVKLVCGVVGIFGAAGTFKLTYIYTCELFPKRMSNTALGLASQAGQIGAIIAPLVVVIASVNPVLPFAIIGVSGIVGGVLAFMLPETSNCVMYETMTASAFENGEATTVEMCMSTFDW